MQYIFQFEYRLYNQPTSTMASERVRGKVLAAEPYSLSLIPGTYTAQERLDSYRLSAGLHSWATMGVHVCVCTSTCMYMHTHTDK